MTVQVFLSGILIGVLGASAPHFLGDDRGIAFLQGAFTLGGGLVICGLFTFKARWHGIIGAGVLALLGLARGLGNLPSLVGGFSQPAPHDPAPLMEFGVTAVCAVLLARVLNALSKEKTRRLMDPES